MMMIISPVDYERNLALYGASLMVVPPLADTTPPKREVDEPDAVAPKLRQLPVYENKNRQEPQTHPISARWQKPQSQPAGGVSQQPLSDLQGVFSLQEQLGEQTPLQLGVLPQQAAVVYVPRPEPPPVVSSILA